MTLSLALCLSVSVVVVHINLHAMQALVQVDSGVNGHNVFLRHGDWWC